MIMYQHLAQDLIKIFNENAYLSIVLDNSIKELKLNLQSKKIYTKILYGVTEKKILIDFNLKNLLTGKRVKPYLKNILRIGAYVIDEMKMADYYIVNELVKTVKKTDYKGAMFVNAILRKYQNSPKPSLNALTIEEKVSIELSLPLDITKILYQQYGTQMLEFFKPAIFYNSYRINLLKTDVLAIDNALQQLKVNYEIKDDAIITKESLLSTDLFKTGLIIAQDISSMQVAKILNPKPYTNVLDVCSAPGGKSLHIATLMQNTGTITACDLYENKLNKILENALKLGITNINVMLADATNFVYPKQYDYVVCDVPCSGLGVINHKPDLKYHLKLNDIDDINQLQEKIINNAKKYVKLKGILLYSTCTINKNENELLIQNFLLKNPNFIKLEEELLLPSELQDGFYICKIQKIKLEVGEDYE